MNNQQLLELLEAVRTGAIPPQEAASILGHSGYEDLGYAKVDHHRAARQGAAEVIFGQGKSPAFLFIMVQMMHNIQAS